jgi:hypothetical protein
MEEFLTYEEQLECTEWKEKRKRILNRDKHRCRMCNKKEDKNNILHVHHRYYIYDRYAWGYDDSALITLCQDCHQLVHMTLAPMCYAEVEEELIPMNFTPCRRCHGEGYLREYKQIKNGICFRCKGNKFEELINPKKLLNINEYLKNSYTFDLPSIRLTEDEQEQAFQKGRSYHLGIDGFEMNAHKAEHYYRIAAINGYGKAQNNLGDIYLNGFDEIAPNCEIAIRWFIYSAMQGVFQGQSHLAQLYYDGEDVTKNYFISFKWEVLAIKQSDELSAALAIKRVFDHSLEKEIKEVYLLRLMKLASKGNKSAIDFLNRFNVFDYD